MRQGASRLVRNSPKLIELGLDAKCIGLAVDYVHEVLDAIDEKLVESGGQRLAELVELANLSAILGNLFRGGIVKASDGKFLANAPHKYPDLLGVEQESRDIEIKVALESNKPKGHLVKAGPHITVRYVLAAHDGPYVRGKENRGDVPWIWEVRVGELTENHFSFSSTEGDSGKTAVIRAVGMEALDAVYCDLNRAPISRSGRGFAKLAMLFG